MKSLLPTGDGAAEVQHPKLTDSPSDSRTLFSLVSGLSLRPLIEPAPGHGLGFSVHTGTRPGSLTADRLS